MHTVHESIARGERRARPGYRDDFFSAASALVSRSARFYGDARFQEIGEECRIDDYTVLSGKFTIGPRAHIAPGVTIHGGPDGVIIEEGVGISAGTHIFAISDDYDSPGLFNPCIDKAYKADAVRGPVIIGAHSVIGANCVVLPGTVVGEHTAVGALSLVRGVLDPYALYVGTPVRKVRDRDRAAIDAIADRYNSEASCA